MRFQKTDALSLMRWLVDHTTYFESVPALGMETYCDFNLGPWPRCVVAVSFPYAREYYLVIHAPPHP